MSSRAKIIALVLAALSIGGFCIGYGSHNPLVDLAFRTWNLALFVIVICYLAGGKIKAYFKNRSEGIARELDDLAAAKAEAMKHMKQVEERIINLDAERQSILADYKAQGEAIKSDIIIKAEKTAKQIVTQAKVTAQNEVEKAMEQMRGEISEEIIAAAEKLLSERLTTEEHEQLIKKSLTKVVLN